MDELLQKKLQIKPEMNIFYDADLKVPYTPSVQYDGMIIYADSKESLKMKFDQHISQLKEDGLFWVVFPKSKKKPLPLRRDEGFEYLGTLNYEPVRNISYDDNLSAIRFRKLTYIKKLTRKKETLLSRNQ